MHVLRTTLLTLGALVAAGVLVDRASRMRTRFVQMTLDATPAKGVAAWP